MTAHAQEPGVPVDARRSISGRMSAEIVRLKSRPWTYGSQLGWVGQKRSSCRRLRSDASMELVR